jgi:hypothetical protein
MFRSRDKLDSLGYNRGQLGAVQAFSPSYDGLSFGVSFLPYTESIAA